MKRSNIPTFQDLVDLVKATGPCGMNAIVEPLELKSPAEVSELKGRLDTLVKQGKLNQEQSNGTWLYTVPANGSNYYKLPADDLDPEPVL